MKWRNNIHYILRGADASRFIPFAKSLLRKLKRFHSGSLTQTVRGAKIRVLKFGDYQQVRIRTTLTGDFPLCVYEFAAHVPFINYEFYRWFKIFWLLEPRTGGIKWECYSYLTDNVWGLEPPMSGFGDTESVNLTAELLLTVPTKKNCHVHTQYDMPQTYRTTEIETAYRTVGAGDMFDDSLPATLYGQYPIDQPFGGITVYLPQLQTRNGFPDTSAPQVESLTPDGEYKVSISPKGKIIVSRVNGSGNVLYSGTDKPDWPAEWLYEENVEQPGGQWAAFRLHPDCKKAITVLHGNMVCTECYNQPGFDETRLLKATESDWKLKGAFQSAVFELNISWTDNEEEGTINVNGSWSQVTSTEWVECDALGGGENPKYSAEGKYYVFADYSHSGSRRYAWVEWEHDTHSEWLFNAPAYPWSTAIYQSGIGSKPGTQNGPLVPNWSSSLSAIPCQSAGQTRFGGYWSQVRFLAPHGKEHREKDTRQFYKATLKFNTEFTDIVIQQAGFTKHEEQGDGYYGNKQINSMDNNFTNFGNTYNGDVNLYRIKAQDHVSGGYTIPNPGHCLAKGQVYQTTNPTPTILRTDREVSIDIEYDNTIRVNFIYMDLRNGVIVYERTTTERTEYAAAGTITNIQSGNPTYNGCVTTPNTTVTVERVLRAPGESGTIQVSQSYTPGTTICNGDPEHPNTTSFPFSQPAIPASNGSSVAQQNTKLWHHMVLGTINPLTLGVGGAYITWVGDMPNYYPRQIAVEPGCSTGGTETGSYAYRITEYNGVQDVIHVQAARDDENISFSISHSAAIARAASHYDDAVAYYESTLGEDHGLEPEEIAARARAAYGLISPDDLDNLTSRGRYMTRGHFLTKFAVLPPYADI